MNDLMSGLQVSVLGLLITFLALGVFILIMIVLQRLFPNKAEAAEAVEVLPQGELLEVVEIEDESLTAEGEVVAAIAAAIAVARGRSRSSLGNSLQESKGSWWSVRKMEARLGKVEKR